MKKILVFISCMVSAISVWGQKENFDLISFTPPQGWKKEVRETLVIYTSIDQVKRIWCQVAVVKSTISKGSVEQDFDSEWQELIIKNYNPPAAPQVNEVVESDGFKIKSGSAGFTFNNSDAYAILTSFSGHQRCASIVVTSNSQDFLVDVEAFLASVELTIPKVISNVPKEQPGVAVSDGFTFTTTNFDNGWTSTVQADWVQAVKGNIKALIHYPNKAVDDYNPDLLQGLKYAWTALVAPKYQSVTNLEFKPVSGWETVELAEADAVEAATGRSVHLVFFKKNYYGGNGKYIEFITPDKKTFEQEFGVLNDATDWNILAGVATYNKFAVAEADLKGKWTSNFTGMLQYVNAMTGLDAGMNTHASNQNFEFLPGQKYNWDLAVASGMVGNIKFTGVKSKGSFSMKGNWQIHLSDIEGKPRVYDVYFTCIKGHRMLWIDNQAYGKAE